jgi:peptide/nickel transport system permease protein
MHAVALTLRALASGLLAWLLIQALLFAMVHAVPGGPAAALAGDYATRETQAAVSRSFALDRPGGEQFVTFVGRLALGDWGLSDHFRRPVAGLLAERLVPTVLLVLGSLSVSLWVGRKLGLWAATHPRGGAFAAAAATAAYAVPVFWVGQLLMVGPGLEMRWFPVSGMSDPRLESAGTWAVLLDVARHAVLPITALAIQQTAFFLTVVHAKARVELGQAYVRAARARGLPEKIIIEHVARNVSPQLATAALNRVGMLFTGAVLVETLFAWPGLGRLLSTAILNRDHPVLLGCFGLIVMMVIVSSVAADIVQARLDPRIAAGQGA